MKRIILNGGTGNQLFQIAEALDIMRTGESVVIDDSIVSTQWFQKYILKQRVVESCLNFFYIDSDIKITNSFFTLFYILLSKLLKRLTYNHLKLIADDRACSGRYMLGYWQNPELASLLSGVLTSARDNQNIKNSEILDLIASAPSVAIHIRRGDYLLPENSYFYECTEDYYLKAISLVGEGRFYIFSDDIPWSKSIGIFPEDSIFVDHNSGDNSHMDMILMSKCEKLIIANSTFSIWAALLSNSKHVIAPKYYYKGIENSIVLPEWTLIEG
ncbi:MAG: hypothetical protein COA68_03740 [Oceanobacter sp.]|jgi:hypothetical protein|nr:MAG: hypothetical protein COA68_03740 [Oceanobacter sp.]|tara:strand:+ start:10532 stop:11347 length:816 start_codon:yes stop_codon:yes gene_type:complete